MAPEPRTFRLTLAPAAVFAVAALALAGCGGSAAPAAKATSAPPSSPSASSTATAQAATAGKPTQAPPAGYQWIGSAAQHTWLAVPDSWVVLNLNDLSVTQAMERVRLKGQPADTMRTAIAALKQYHALMALDTGSVAASPNKFATNVNSFCTPSPIQPGAGAASTVASAARAQISQVGGHVVAINVVTNTATSVVVRVEDALQVSGGVTVHQIQYDDLTSQSQICYTTFTTDQPAKYFPLFATMAATIHAG
jgi:hypothetical protein